MNPDKDYPRPFTTVDIIIQIEDKFVMIERKNPPEGWALPGGFLNEGETLEEAAIREAKEETNLDLTHLFQFHTYSNPNRDPRGWFITTVFDAKGIGEPIALDDAKNIQLVDFEDLPDVIAFDHREIIEEYKDFINFNIQDNN